MEQVIDRQNINKEYKEASKAKRFTNYLIDVVCYFILSFVVGFVRGIILVLFGNIEVLGNPTPSVSQSLVELLLGMAVLLSYYVFCEHFFKGKTLGKLITKTRAVKVNNERMDFGTTLKRTLFRLIPFEAFSFLVADKNSGWHDNWSDTKVIEDDNWDEF